MTNKHSSVGITEDLVTNIMHLGAQEYHLEILIRKYEDQNTFWYHDAYPHMQSEEDKIAVHDNMERIFNFTEILSDVTTQRRQAMLKLKEQSTEDGNPDVWCSLKHSLIAVITAFEVWQVDLWNEDLKSAFIDQSRTCNRLLATFLGYEVTPCSACLTDQLKEDGK